MSCKFIQHEAKKDVSRKTGKNCLILVHAPMNLIFLPGQPEEGFLEVVVTLGGDIIVLKILLSVEHNALGLDLPVLDVHLVPGQHDGYVLADPDQIPVPIRHVLVGHTRGYIEHDDGTLTLNIVWFKGVVKSIQYQFFPGIKYPTLNLSGFSIHPLFSIRPLTLP